MKTIYTKVVADLFHPGHVNLFRNARALGDRLVVHVVDDARVTAFKRQPIMNQRERLELVAACRYVDQAVEEGPRVITRAFMEEHGYSIYAFAYADEKELVTKRKDCPDLPDTMIATLVYTPGISTTQLFERMRQRLSDSP